jgi:hypothetical protein
MLKVVLVNWSFSSLHLVPKLERIGAEWSGVDVYLLYENSREFYLPTYLSVCLTALFSYGMNDMA